MVITFNFEGLEKEPGVYHERTGYMQEYRLPCFNIAADHPYYYHEDCMICRGSIITSVLIKTAAVF